MAQPKVTWAVTRLKIRTLFSSLLTQCCYDRISCVVHHRNGIDLTPQDRITGGAVISDCLPTAIWKTDIDSTTSYSEHDSSATRTFSIHDYLPPWLVAHRFPSRCPHQEITETPMLWRHSKCASPDQLNGTIWGASDFPRQGLPNELDPLKEGAIRSITVVQNRANLSHHSLPQFNNEVQHLSGLKASAVCYADDANILHTLDQS